jgi:hypothetical protein
MSLLRAGFEIALAEAGVLVRNIQDLTPTFS